MLGLGKRGFIQNLKQGESLEMPLAFRARASWLPRQAPTI